MDDQLKDKLVEMFEAMISLLDKTNTGLKSLNKEIKSEEDKLKAFDRQLSSARDGVKKISESFRTGAVDAEAAFKQIQGMNQALIRNKNVIDKETAARIKEIETSLIIDQSLNAFGETLESATKSLATFAVKAGQDIVRDLQGTGNAFTLASKIINGAATATFGTIQTFGSTVEGVGKSLESIPGKAAIAGSILEGAGKIIGYAAKATQETVKFAVEVLNAEVLKSITVFNNNSKAGIFFANGMSSLTEQLNKSNISYRDFFGALQGATAQLAMIGGSQGRAATKVFDTFNELQKYRVGLEKLGISTEEQIQGTAEYMAILARTGKLEGKNAAELAKGTDEYLTNLKVITSITGEEAKTAQNRARVASTQMAVQTELMRLGQGAGTKFNQAIANVPQELQPAIQQMLAFSNSIVDKDLAAVLNMSPNLLAAFTQTVNDIRNPSIGATEALDRFNAMLRDPAIAKEMTNVGDTIGKLGLFSGQFSNQLSGMSEIQRRQLGLAAVEEGEARARTMQQKATMDALTNSVVNASIKFQELQASIEQNLKKPMESYATFVANQIKSFSEAVASAMRALTGQGQPTTATFGETTGRSGEPGAVTGRAIPKKALGGIVTSPAIAGEAGPEAVVPLPDGRTIPTNIDLSPLVQAIGQQVLLTSEMLDEIRDSKYIQEKILVASQ